MIDFSRATALLGGSFDPVHEGHLHIAESVRRLLPTIEQIVFVPAAHSPGKNPIQATGADRLRWLQLAIGPHGFLVWDWEVRNGGESYTVETLRQAHALGAQRAKLFWIMGADAYANFPQWREPEVIRTLAKLIVVNRPGAQVTRLAPEDFLLEIPPHPASSTAIRAALAEAQETVPHLAPEVRQDIKGLVIRGLNPYARK